MTSPDAVDQASENMVTMTITGAAIGVSSWADRMRQNKASGKQKAGLDFRRPTEFGERDPLPKGLLGTISTEEWRGMDDAQRRMVDPDRVGRWPTDYTLDHAGVKGTPGATLQSTLDQDSRIRVLAVEANQPVPNVGEMSRGRAAEYLRGLEEKLGPTKTGAAYLNAGMVHRTVAVDPDGNAHHQLVFPDAQGKKGVATLPDPTPVQPPLPTPKLSVSNQTVLTDPSTWKTADKPVTPAQRHSLAHWGFKPEEIDKLRKGGASSVLSAIESYGQTDAQAVDRAYEKAVAVAIQVPPAQQPPPTQAPQPGGHSR